MEWVLLSFSSQQCLVSHFCPIFCAHSTLLPLSLGFYLVQAWHRNTTIPSLSLSFPVRTSRKQMPIGSAQSMNGWLPLDQVITQNRSAVVRWQITWLKRGCLSLPRSTDKGQFQGRGMDWETLTDRPDSYRITMQGTNQFIWWGDKGRRLVQGFIWRSDLALGAKNDISAVDESSILELLDWPIGGIGKVEKPKGPRPSRKLLPNPEWSSFEKR